MNKVEFDNALNEAGWVMISELQEHGELNGGMFNAMKACLSVAIDTYLAEKGKEVPTETPEEKEALDTIKQVEWDGEGLPPVGVECEIYCPVNPESPDGDKRWAKTEIVAIIDCGFGANTTVVYKTGWSGDWYVDAHPSDLLKFRKPKTPEANKVREAVENLHDASQQAESLALRETLAHETLDKSVDEQLKTYRYEKVEFVSDKEKAEAFIEGGLWFLTHGELKGDIERDTIPVTRLDELLCGNAIYRRIEVTEKELAVDAAIEIICRGRHDGDAAYKREWFERLFDEGVLVRVNGKG